MEFIPKNRILEFKPDTMEYIRREYNLYQAGQMKWAVQVLQDWVQKQNYFKKKDFSEAYYEKSIIGCKGSIDRAKAQIDKYCTFRTVLPHFFGEYNVKRHFSNIVMLPKLTDDHYRVEVVKFHNRAIRSSTYTDLFKSTIILAEYLKAHDYINGFILILDYSEANLMEFTTKLNPVELRQILTIVIEAYGMRIKGIHIITASKFIDALITIIKQVLSAKVAGRVYVHKSIEEIYEIIPRSILPKDYGGDERTLKKLQEEWNEAISSEEHLKYIREMNKAGTDESCRQTDHFTGNYAGMPGTFRLLSVD